MLINSQGNDHTGLFCHEPILSEEALRSSFIPVFSQCALHTIFTWIPCVFLYLVAPIVAAQCYFTTERPLPWTHLLRAKLAFAFICLLNALCLCGLCVYEFFNGDFHYVDFLQSVLLTIAAIVLIALCITCQQCGKLTSGGIFLSWLMFLLCGLPEAYFWFCKETFNTDDTVHLTMFGIWYTCVVLETVLYSFADKPDETFEKIDENESEPCIRAFPSPEVRSSFLNRQFMWWFNTICVKGIHKPLEVHDLYSLNPGDCSAPLVNKWDKLWNSAMIEYRQSISPRNPQHSKHSKHPEEDEIMAPSIIWCLFRLFQTDILTANALKCVADLLTFVSPIVLESLIKFTSDLTQPLWIGIVFALMMFISSELSSLLLNQYYYLMYRVGTRIQSVLTSAIYSKALRLSNPARRDKTVGEIVNLMAIDIDRFQKITPQTYQFWSTPMQITLSLYLLWRQLGVSVLSGVGVMILLLPVNFICTMVIRRWHVQQMRCKDERTKMVNEVLNGIKVIKLYGWEPPMEKVVNELREKELSLIRKAALLQTFSDMLNLSSPFLVALFSFATFIFMDQKNVLTPAIAFVSLALFNQLRSPMSTVSDMVSQIVQVAVSNKRLKAFLVADELVSYVDNSVRDDNTVITVEEADLSWDSAEGIAILNNLCLRIQRGQFIAIVGRVGSGKSSFCHALLGEMEKLRGYVALSGRVAYVPQQPWMQNASVRDNIIFGRRYEEYFYNRVMDACSLFPDLQMLSMGDQTEIGEKGINLSGGQKARISLARAIYQNYDVYLMDDPLAAVDAHVGQELFQAIIGPDGMLRNKTRILITNELNYLRNADLILVLKNGKIAAEGNYDVLSKSGALDQLLIEVAEERRQLASQNIDLDDELEYVDSEDDDTFFANDVAGIENSPDQILGTSHMSTVSGILSRRQFQHHKRRRISTAKCERTKIVPDASKQLIQAERVENGRIKLSVYQEYFKSMGSSLFALFVFGLTMSTIISMLRNLWLTNWSDDNDQDPTKKQTVGVRLTVYALLGFSEVGMLLLGMLSLLFGRVAASRNLHAPLLRAIFHAPMSFFDTTPSGRILNRVGKDIETIDIQLPSDIEFFAECLLQVFSTLFMIVYNIRSFGVVIIPLGAMYFMVLRYYLATSRQLKRLESITRSPIYSHLSESIHGVASIRSYGLTESFTKSLQRKVDTHVQCRYLNYVANRWLSVRLELIGNCVVLFAALFAVCMRGITSSGVIGLAVSYSLSITFVLNFAVRSISKLETNIVSVERVREYANTPSEAPWHSAFSLAPIENWPNAGKIIFSDYSTRYRTGLDCVVRELTIEIGPHEKIGIVGRTGAGKSSITMALFRMIEAVEGSIFIDGIDIADLGLHELRSNITIIPQDPVLFSGTLRFNLDPFGLYSDADIWKALELANLLPFASSSPSGLEYEITERGDNISVGQRQLVCLARALLRKTKVLVLDEATAAVDQSTDVLIQRAIRQEFADSTVLTIAHRLNTILDYDKIIVLADGRIIEYGSPQQLLADKTTEFYSMVTSSRA